MLAFDWSYVLRQDILPVAAAYGLFVWVIVAYGRSLRSQREERPDERPPGRRGIPLVTTCAAGYAVFAAIVLVFYLGLGGRRIGFVFRTLAAGAVMATGTAVIFTALSWAEARLRKRAQRAR